jgi:CBS domain containing-hemolysin-like protein
MDPEPSILLTVILILFAFILISLNAFFVAAEFAIVKVRRTRLEELAGKGVQVARISILCIDQLDEYLSATQLGITIVSLALGWIGEESFYKLFVILFPNLLRSTEGPVHFIAAAFSFFIITLFHVVLGELVPKSMAIQNAEKITLAVSRPLSLFYKLTRPLIRTFTYLANVVLHRLGYLGLEEPPMSEEELKLVMKESHEEGIISDSEAQIITRAFSFSDKRALDIMIPADKVEYLSLARSFEENIEVTKKRMHTRFPLTNNGLHSVVGVIHMKDAFHLRSEHHSNELFRRIMKPVIFVNPKMREDQLMKVFKERRAHLAIVQDPDTKNNLGIVTMEDILEELVGDIQDEHGN